MLTRFWCMSFKKFRCCSKFLISLTHWYVGQNCVQLYLKRYILSLSFLNKKKYFYSNSKIIYNFCVYRGNTPPVEVEKMPPGEKFFILGIFWKNTSKYAKLIVEPHICNNLNQIYRFFHLKKKWKESHLKTSYKIVWIL